MAASEPPFRVPTCTGLCPFTFSMQQPMRNLAMARGLEQCNDSGVERGGLHFAPTMTTKMWAFNGRGGGACSQICMERRGLPHRRS